MSSRAPRPGAGGWQAWLTGAVACALGLAASMLTAGPALFADGPFSERPPVLAVSIVVFLVLGAACGLLVPSHWKAGAIGLVLAAFPVVLFFGRDVFSNPKMLVLAVGFALGDAAAGAGGALVGARVRHRVR